MVTRISASAITQGVYEDYLSDFAIGSISDSDKEDTASEFSATIDWGDGTTTSGTIEGSNGAFTVMGHHPYESPGTYVLALTVDNANNTTSTATANITVLNDIGISTSFFAMTNPGTFSGTIGTFTELDYRGQSISNYPVTINWGDGTGLSAATITQQTGSFADTFNISGPHTFSSYGVDLITGTVREISEINSNTFQMIGIVEPSFSAAPAANTSIEMIMRQGSNLEIYEIGNNNIVGAGNLGGIDPSWQITGFGGRETGFDGSYSAAMILRNSSGEFIDGVVSGNSITQGFILGQVGPEWGVAGFADFSGNTAEGDMLMRNSNTGAFEVYDLNNLGFTGFHGLGQVGLEWSVAGFADFSGNAGEADMLMRSTSGAFELYDISNNQYTGFFSLGQVGTEWQVAGFGDFSGNANETDMLMRDSSTGAFELYDIRNNQYTDFISMGQVGTEWQVAGFGDFSGNANETDMLMRNSNTGAFEIYDINNNQFTGFHAMGQVGLAWSVAGFLTGSATTDSTSSAQMTQAMASVGASSSSTSASAPASDATQQQPLLTAAQQT